MLLTFSSLLLGFTEEFLFPRGFVDDLLPTLEMGVALCKVIDDHLLTLAANGFWQTLPAHNYCHFKTFCGGYCEILKYVSKARLVEEGISLPTVAINTGDGN